ncbi:LysR family transcriptional regulator [Streptomyces sp. NPDC059455]|uniref:LysR family transcriptional regulator n=1 Tax=Streptomyces sp. NPDC059455 TaxID=3346837 RepID=UPI0036769347
MSSSSTPDNRISLHKLEVFCSVVERGGVRLAAEDLFVSQPVVSAHLRSLEERLKVKLFQRDGRGMKLTEAGVEVHQWAAGVLRGRTELDRSLRDISRGVAGRASIGSSMSVGNYVLPRILVDFRREHPHASISLNQSSVEVALDRTLDGRHDFAVVATDAVVDANTFEAKLIAQPPFCLVTAPDDERIGDSVSADELGALPFVCPPAGMAIRRSQDSALASIGVVDRRVEIELGSAESMKVAVRGGLGVALLWRESVRRELEAGLLREVQIHGHTLHDKLYLVQRRGKKLTAFQFTLTEVLREGIHELLGQHS